MKGSITPEDYSQGENKNISTSIFVANQIKKGKTDLPKELIALSDNGTVFRVRNRIKAGDILEVLSTNGTIKEITVPDQILKTDGNIVTVVQNEEEIILPYKLGEYTILRRIKG